ncbi:hypothetical protein [Alistipes sp.]|uniref:hypothetical protein n=1 Tax=Alistipes sp. TaxID=1872444 RepID=UPI0025C2E609|nr:hypothetical protein [Alistipes sp.]
MRQEAGQLDEVHSTQAQETTLSMATENLYDSRAHAYRHMADDAPSRIVTCGSSAGAVTVPMGE